MFVVTIDQRGSRGSRDLVPGLLAALEDVPTLASFDRTAGDEVQGVLGTVAAVREVVLTALRQRSWHCGVGIGAVEEGSWSAGTRSGRGPAFVAAREAVEAAKSLHHAAFRVPDEAPAGSREHAEDCEAVWGLVSPLVEGRTDAQWRVLDAVSRHPTQSAAAAELGMSPSAVASALRRSRSREERAAYRVLDRLLEDAHAAACAGEAG